MILTQNSTHTQVRLMSEYSKNLIFLASIDIFHAVIYIFHAVIYIHIKTA